MSLIALIKAKYNKAPQVPKLTVVQTVVKPNVPARANESIVTAQQPRARRECTSFDELNINADKLLYCDPSHPLCLSKEDQNQFLLVLHTQEDQKALVVILSSNASKSIEDKLAKYKTLAIKEYDLKGAKTIVARAAVLTECLQKIKSSDHGKSNEELVAEFDQLLAHAIAHDASDIHIRIRGVVCEVSLRVHGEMQRCDSAKYDANFAHKMMMAMYNGKGVEGQKDDMFEPRRKQQTVFERVIDQHKYRIRFASAPVESPNIEETTQGQSYVVAMRILATDRSAIKPLKELGYTVDQIKAFSEAVKSPHGGIILAGTTGSGKSTALAALISNLVHDTGGTKKIYSVESPVEYIIDGVEQLTVHDSAKMTEDQITHEFNLTLKQLVRLDPDVIYCNEIRNEGTAKFSQKAIQSGHLYFSTIHAQDAVSTIERLCGIGIQRDVVCALNFLQLIVYQTLVQTLCAHCSLQITQVEDERYVEIKQVLNAVIQMYALPHDIIQHVRVRNKNGCKHCNHSGVSGRTVIAEFLKPNANILQYIRSGNQIEAYRAWRHSGGITIKENALVRVFKGELCPYSLEYKIGALHIDVNNELIDSKILHKTLNKALSCQFS